MTFRGVVTRILVWWDSLRSTYWFVPSSLVAISIALSIGMAYVDSSVSVPLTVHHIWWLYTGDAEGARSLLSAIATSIMTATSVTFSITVAAFSLASQQYGPRMLRGFLRDIANQISLGVFLATFIYNLIVLREVRAGSVPNLSVSVAMGLMILSVGFFIFFIHHVTQSIQSESIIDNAGSELNAAIRRLYPQDIGSEFPQADDDATSFLSGLGIAGEVRNRKFGYVTAIDDDRLLRTAIDHDIVVEIVKRPGSYAERGAMLVRVYPAERLTDVAAKNLEQSFHFGTQRSTVQDVAFAINELVEVAVRALSPALNNPFTAVMVLDRLSTSFTLLAQRHIPSSLRRDEAGAIRVVTQALSFEDALHLALDPIRHYGDSSEIVTRSINGMLQTVELHVTRDRDRAAIDRERETVTSTQCPASR